MRKRYYGPANASLKTQKYPFPWGIWTSSKGSLDLSESALTNGISIGSAVFARLFHAPNRHAHMQITLRAKSVAISRIYKAYTAYMGDAA